MKQENRSNLQKGTQRTERERSEEQLKPLQQPGREDVSLDNEELETDREENPGRRERQAPERTTERSDRRL
jgi:hypothetical protein